MSGKARASGCLPCRARAPASGGTAAARLRNSLGKILSIRRFRRIHAHKGFTARPPVPGHSLEPRRARVARELGRDGLDRDSREAPKRPRRRKAIDRRRSPQKSGRSL